MTFPLDSINLLLSMVRGTVPFDLVPAIKAALQIAEYVISLYDPKVLGQTQPLPMSETPDLDLEQALAQVVDGHKAGMAYARKHKLGPATSISGSLLYFILQELFTWIAGKVQS